MTIRERQRQLAKRMGVSGLLILAAGGTTFSMMTVPEKQEAVQTSAVIRTYEPISVKEPEAVIATAQAPVESLGLSAADEYRVAKMAMAEAEGEDIEGKALVILVILNRVESEEFPNSIIEVLSQKNAFTSYGNGRYNQVEPDADCKAALKLVKKGWDESQGALYFEHTPETGKNTWHSRNLKKLFIHGNHTFYTEKEVGSFEDGNEGRADPYKRRR